jgi:hypothetical protein
MTCEEALNKFDNYLLEKEYAEFIFERAKGERIITNSDVLTRTMESLYLVDEFIESIVD